jgi:hypothetical protein
MSSTKAASPRSGQPKAEPSVTSQILATYGYVTIWIALSATVILYNKYILTWGNFPYPVALTLWHMAFCSTLAFAIIKLGYVQSINMSTEMYLKTIVPIGALYSGTLWLGNAAYLFLSVSFIQMLKALMPVAVFCVGCVFATEKFSMGTFGNMMIVSLGVAIASYGELNFVVIGVVLQLFSIVTESTRLVLVQILLQRRGLKLNPITSLYYISPACFCFLLLPFLMFELPKIRNDPSVVINPAILFSNAAAAFALNMAVFLLIGKTSALTMNIAGVVKDWLLIGLSVMLYKSPVSPLNLGGYVVAFLAVCLYNYRKLKEMQRAKDAAALQPKPAAPPADPETEPLVKR